MKRKPFFFCLMILITFSIIIIGGEMLTRTFYTSEVRINVQNLVYRYDSELGWFPIENSDSQFQGDQLIQVKHNKIGFRDVQHGEKQKKRIAFIGDSFVWGYDVEQNERFTDILQEKIPEYEIFNMGISGYGNDQEYLLLKKWFDHIQPDIVFLALYQNDRIENSTNSAHGGYYKPYFINSNEELILKGTPVPKAINYYIKQYPLLYKSKLIQLITETLSPPRFDSEDPTALILKEMNNYVISKGAEFYIGIIDSDTSSFEHSICEQNNIEHLLLLSDLKYKTHGRHWTAEGHNAISNTIYDFFLEKKAINSNSLNHTTPSSTFPEQ